MAKIRLTARGRAIASESESTTASPNPAPRTADKDCSTPGQEEEEVQTVDPLVLEPGSIVLMVAGQAPRGRIGSAVALELRLCARHHGIGPDRLRAISAGLCALLPITGAAVRDRASTDEEFLEDVARLAGVRRAPMRLLSASSDADISAAAASAVLATAALQIDVNGEQSDGTMQGSEATCGGEVCPWGLEIESLYPENVPARLPYMYVDTGGTPGSVFGFAIALSARLGDKVGEWGPGGHSQTDPKRQRLVAIECTTATGASGSSDETSATTVPKESKNAGVRGRCGRLLLTVENASEAANTASIGLLSCPQPWTTISSFDRCSERCAWLSRG